jgi:hypothetical protein
MAQRGILIPATLNELCIMVPEASITPTTNDGTVILENVNALNNALIEVLRSAIPVVKSLNSSMMCSYYCSSCSLITIISHSH